MKSLRHYLRRISEIGREGGLSNAILAIRYRFRIRLQSIWWWWQSRRSMSDAEFLSNTTGIWDSMEAFLRHLATRPASSYLFPHDSRETSVSLLKEKYPEYVSNVIASADAVCRSEIYLLGKVYSYSDKVDWHMEPVTGFHWPVRHRSQYAAYLYSVRRPADLIVYWELNRHQFFIILGIAYWLTNEERFVDAFCALAGDWIDKNPFQHGMNWYYPLEISIRLLAWTAAFQFFRVSPSFQEKIGSNFIKRLWQQADFLSGHLQTTRTKKDIPNNHIFAELAGLFMVASAFPEFQAAHTWRETAQRLIVQQVGEQIHPDGMHKEQAIGYHRFVLELLLIVFIRCKRDSLPVWHDLAPTLEKMFDYLLFSATPAGTIPAWGDSDYGKALGLGLEKDFWDVTPLLSTGAVLFDRADMKFTAKNFDSESFWMLGPEAFNAWNSVRARAPMTASKHFSHGGMYIIRDSWSPNTDVAYFRCGPFGLGGAGYCAHAHCDLLSFVLWVNGAPLLVDSGTYMYSGEWRSHFRLTHSHNTVMVDGVQQGDPKRFFGWTRISEAECKSWNGKAVSGRMTPVNGVELVREFSHPKQAVWELKDKTTCKEKGAHRLEWFFHFAPGLEIVLGETSHSIVKNSKVIGTISTPDNGIQVETKSAWFSYQYGEKVPNVQIYAVWEGDLTENETAFRWNFSFNPSSAAPRRNKCKTSLKM